MCKILTAYDMSPDQMVPSALYLNQEARSLLVSITEAAKLLLAGCVPAAERYLAMARVEVQRGHLHPDRR
jgi:hypothetical protein